MSEIASDGAGERDRAATITVDRKDEPWRWTCPHGHTDWERTNSHGWCRTCRRHYENGEDVDPEHYELWDRKHDRKVSYSRVRFERSI